MPVVNELIKKETDGSLSFGNYELAVKSKVVDFKYEGYIRLRHIKILQS